MKLALIPCSPCEWRIEKRVLGRVELPPAEDAGSIHAAWADRLRELPLARILYAPDELSEDRARKMAAALRVRARAAAELNEVDVGLWAGLTGEQLEARYSSAFHQLCEAPLSVSAPGGEDFRTALDRLLGCLRRRLRSRREGEAVGIVLRPLARALLSCALSGGDFSRFWEQAQQDDDLVLVDPPAVAGPRPRNTER